MLVVLVVVVCFFLFLFFIIFFYYFFFLFGCCCCAVVVFLLLLTIEHHLRLRMAVGYDAYSTAPDNSKKICAEVTILIFVANATNNVRTNTLQHETCSKIL